MTWRIFLEMISLLAVSTPYMILLWHVWRVGPQ